MRAHIKYQMHAVARVDGASLNIAAKAAQMCRNENRTEGVREKASIANVKNLQL
jgi:hypothetical protein